MNAVDLAFLAGLADIQGVEMAPRLGRKLAAEVLRTARAHADAVDGEGRFPEEAFQALRTAGALGALIPAHLGGAGLSLVEVAAQCQALGSACSNSAMILAMHHIQIACLVRHAAGQAWVQDFLQRVQSDQLLLGSSTSEAGVGGSMRTSLCALLSEHGRFTVRKTATAISYGARADALLVTTRQGPDAPASDQVIVVVERDGLDLEKTASWDAMGMRGTGSDAFMLTGAGLVEQVLETPFADISAMTMVPVSHILWGAVWTGVAWDAVERARQGLKKHRRADGAASPSALRLARAVEILQLAEARVRMALADFVWDRLEAPGFAQQACDNGLKASVAEACLDVVTQAMAVCGFAGYARSGPSSVSRHLRDLHSAPLMISNERIRESSAQLLLAQRPSLGLDRTSS
jgi:acyl-CoA dehydrogenase